MTKFHRLPFSFEPKFPFLPCSTPVSMRDTHSKHSSFLKSRVWQPWDYSFAFHCLFCSPSKIPTEAAPKIMRPYLSRFFLPQEDAESFSWEFLKNDWGPVDFREWTGNGDSLCRGWLVEMMDLKPTCQEDLVSAAGIHPANCSLAQENKPVTKKTNTAWFHLHEMSKAVKCIDTEIE